jgi:predicted RNase H-like HicB family nuclease
MMRQYLVIIEKGQNNLSAYSPDVLGCVATGKTLEETVQQMTQALYFHLEQMSQQGEQMPQARGLTDHIDEINTTAGDFFTFVPININSLKAIA